MRIIAGRWKGHRLGTVRGRGVRPTSDRLREAWMSALGERVQGARVVDHFAGSGALGLEALSRGAASVVFVERARGALAALRANVERLGAGDAAVVREAEVFRFLASVEEPFDLALADPPYEGGWAARLVERFLAEPFARELWVEHRWRDPLPLPEGARTRRYGGSALSTLSAGLASTRPEEGP
ncbi:MAG TPA: 16S rRNA (guanine(966)-N(2))-methyltransferase RsmD [Longimicrobiales bacterium]|nr:16S rRNA (guanine(966)-N(2))-methyltransferase RsmD [Longimicrobiales bacterium]